MASLASRITAHAPIASTSRRTLSSTPIVSLYRPQLKKLRKVKGRPAWHPTYYGVPDRRIPPTGWQDSDIAAAHPLWQFFHNKDPTPLIDTRTQHGGRAWLEEELRRKSFEDLHQLWYILIKERAVLLTQRHEMKRLHIDVDRTYVRERLLKVGKSMGRIKHVINQRRIAFHEAKDILKTRALQERYPGLVASDDRSLAILQAQEWRWLNRNDPLGGKAEVLEAEPEAVDGTWEYVPPERRSTRATASVADRISARHLLERAFARRMEARAAVRNQRKVERNMAAQARRLAKRIEETGSAVQVPPYLARYGTEEVQRAIQVGLPVDELVKARSDSAEA